MIPASFAFAAIRLPTSADFSVFLPLSRSVLDTVIERAARHVVDELRVDVLERAEDDEARTLRGARHLLPNAEVTAIALLLARLRNCWHGITCLPPYRPYGESDFASVLDALALVRLGRTQAADLRRDLSDDFLVRRLRSTICVGCGAVSLIPAGALYSIGCEKPSASCSPYGRTSAL